jgi:hypothetical protein
MMIKQVLAGAVATAALVFGLTAAAASSARVAPTCRAVVLRPAFGGSQGAAGTFQDRWRLRNVGSATCRLRGYPTVTNYRRDGRPLPMSVSHLGVARTVLLTPGQHASFNLRYTDPGIANCTPQPAARLTIQPPGSARPVITGRGVRACRGQVRETPLVHGG